MTINTINIGVIANDGTGDSIRKAFETVNSNFTSVQNGLFAGAEASIISAASVTGEYMTSNTYVYATTYANVGTLVSRGNITSAGNLFVQNNGAYIVGNVQIIGNLLVSGSQSATQSQTSTGSILNLHYSATPLISDDGKDIGLEWQYYKGAEQRGFLGFQDSTRTLVYLDNITENASNVITAGTPGNVKFGQLLLANTTSSTSNVTGALVVYGGAGIGGNLYVQSNIFVGNNTNVSNLTVRGYHVGSLNFTGTDTVYINGSPVVTSATNFSGGAVTNATQFNDVTQSSSISTGAVTIAGGLGVTGNVFVSNLAVPTGGNIRANVLGNIFTSAQPYITSLGALTGLSMAGTITAFNINPDSNLVYSLGLGGTNRWNKLWVADIDSSGTITAAAMSGTTLSLTNTGDVSANIGTVKTTLQTLDANVGSYQTYANANVSAIQTNITAFQAYANTKIGTNTNSNLVILATTAATSNVTGALVVKGGVGISGGIIANGAVKLGQPGTTSNVVIAGTTDSVSSTTGALVVKGGVGIAGSIYTTGSLNSASLSTSSISASSLAATGVVQGQTLVVSNSINTNIYTVASGFTQFYTDTTTDVDLSGYLVGASDAYHFVTIQAIGQYIPDVANLATNNARLLKSWSAGIWYNSSTGSYTVEGETLSQTVFNTDATNFPAGAANSGKAFLTGSGTFNIAVRFTNRTTPASTSKTNWSYKIEVQRFY